MSASHTDALCPSVAFTTKTVFGTEAVFAAVLFGLSGPRSLSTLFIAMLGEMVMLRVTFEQEGWGAGRRANKLISDERGK